MSCFAREDGRRLSNMEEISLVILLFCTSCICAKSAPFVEPYEEAFLEREEYTLPKMPYNYSALEPYIDEETLRVHHLGHHASYTEQLNGVLKVWRESKEDKELASKSVVEILKNIDKVPRKFQHHVRNVAGGYFNHALLWATMSPNPEGKQGEPGPILAYLIKYTFETFDRFEKWVKHEALDIFGSGYLWICVNPELPHHIVLHSLYNQDNPFARGLYPILLVDVWEHAYYLKHRNKRAAYLDDWWKVVNWEAVETLIERWGINQIHDEL